MTFWTIILVIYLATSFLCGVVMTNITIQAYRRVSATVPDYRDRVPRCSKFERFTACFTFVFYCLLPLLNFLLLVYNTTHSEITIENTVRTMLEKIGEI